jgi:hypothetical protein
VRSRWYLDGERIEITGLGPVPQGATQTPPDPAVPFAVTPLQARRALLAAGLLDEVNAAVQLASVDAKLAWEYATEIRRNDPLIAAVAADLEMDDEQIDALFIAAARL